MDLIGGMDDMIRAQEGPHTFHAIWMLIRSNNLIFVLQIPGIVVAHNYGNLVRLGVRVCDLQS